MAPKQRGRPRSKSSHKAILESALSILNESGVSGVSIEAVAARAKVGKPTIYRYWANAQELSMAALICDLPEAKEAESSKAGLEALRCQLREVIGRFETKSGRQATMLLAAADDDSEISRAFRNQVILKSRSDGRAILEEVLQVGDKAFDHPIESILDMIYGPIFYRLLTKHAPLEANLADDIVDVLSILIDSPAPLNRDDL